MKSSLEERLRDAGYSQAHTLKQSQRNVLLWFERDGAQHHKGAIIAHEPGFGKTASALARIALRKRECERADVPFHKALVVCARSIIKNWITQAGQFFPGARLRIAVLEGKTVSYYVNGVSTGTDKLASSYCLTAAHLDRLDIAVCTYAYPVNCFKAHGMHTMFAKIKKELSWAVVRDGYKKGPISATHIDSFFLPKVISSAQNGIKVRDAQHFNSLVHSDGELGSSADTGDHYLLPQWYRVRHDRDSYLQLGAAMLEGEDRAHAPLFLAQAWDLVVLDEAHSNLINPTSLTCVVVTALEGRRKIVLSGTPVRHHNHGLWPMLSFLETPQLPPYSTVKRLFSMQGRQTRAAKEQQVEENTGRMYAYVKDYIHQQRHHAPTTAGEAARLLATAAQADLRHADEKIKIPAHDEWPNLLARNQWIPSLDSAEERLALENTLDSAMYEEKTDKHGTAITVGVASISCRRFNRVRQAVTDPNLLPSTSAHPMRASATNSTKVRALVDYVCDRALVKADEKVVVFCTWVTTVVSTASAALARRGIRSISITGAMSNTARESLIQQFAGDGTYTEVHDSEEPRVLLATYCLGEGVDRLKRANHVVFLNQDCVKSTHQQAVARAHRLGQQRDVHSLNLLVSGEVNPIDERLLQIQSMAGKATRAIMDSVVLGKRYRAPESEATIAQVTTTAVSAKQGACKRPCVRTEKMTAMVTQLTETLQQRKMARTRPATTTTTTTISRPSRLTFSEKKRYRIQINNILRTRIRIYTACCEDKQNGAVDGGLVHMKPHSQWRRIKELETLRNTIDRVSRSDLLRILNKF